MEIGDQLKDLNMTVDEVDRLTKAFKDEKFKEMLRDYAQELSDPENKKRYEEEIKLLEQERGNTVEFIHPEPFRALRTSVNGKQKCFINICANDKVGKPESKWGLSEEGRRGQCWSLPHSLCPGRQDTDPKGNKITIYDVVFHPDTLHIARTNKGFMDMVDSTAIQGIQNAFKVTLDKNNAREMSTKYKGTPQPCVIRKPIPGYKTAEVSEKPDPLAFPYPDYKSSQTKLAKSPTTKNSSDAEPENIQVQPQKTKEPTQPTYTVKYRSFIDLQDFRCSRDSAQSPRPKEIVVAIDMPLLKVVGNASLEVKEGRLLLESKKPAYRLELPLAYSVDENKGEAKFNKQRGQLTVTLPVLPSNQAFDFAAGPPQTSVSDGESQEETSEVGEDDEQNERECQKSEEEEQRSVEEERGVKEEDLKRLTWGEKEDEGGQEKGEEQLREGQEGVVGEERIVNKEKWRKQEREMGNSDEQEIDVEKEAKRKKQMRKGQDSKEKLKEQKQEKEKEVEKCNPQERQGHEDKGMSKDNKLSKDKCYGESRVAEKKDSAVTRFGCDTVDQCTDVSAERILCVASPERQNQPVLITAALSSCHGKDGGVNLNPCLESTPTTKTKETRDGDLKVKADAAPSHHGSGEESQTTAAAASSTPADTQGQNNISQRTEESSEMIATDELSRGGPGSSAAVLPEELTAISVKPEERESVDEDDLPREQILLNPENDDKPPPPVLLREIDKDGNEKVISDHSTSAGFIFQNSLMYELD